MVRRRVFHHHRLRVCGVLLWSGWGHVYIMPCEFLVSRRRRQCAARVYGVGDVCSRIEHRERLCVSLWVLLRHGTNVVHPVPCEFLLSVQRDARGASPASVSPQRGFARRVDATDFVRVPRRVQNSRRRKRRLRTVPFRGSLSRGQRRAAVPGIRNESPGGHVAGRVCVHRGFLRDHDMHPVPRIEFLSRGDECDIMPPEYGE
jgi:hypothetical protein